MKPMHWFLWGSLLAMGACGPSEKKQAELAEQKRVECLDKWCEGDVGPERDRNTEVAIKLNGQWYVGPKTYFNNYDGRAGFEWWDHKPISRDMKRPPELQALVVDGKGYDVAIEMFLSAPKTPGPTSTYQLLLAEEIQRRVVEKRRLRDGLEAWKTQSGALHETWFIATNLRLPTGEPPVVACRGEDPTTSRCTGGFLWTPEIAAGLRFRATHGPDWPEIYQEINRVLQQLRRG